MAIYEVEMRILNNDNSYDILYPEGKVRVIHGIYNPTNSKTETIQLLPFVKNIFPLYLSMTINFPGATIAHPYFYLNCTSTQIGTIYVANAVNVRNSIFIPFMGKTNCNVPMGDINSKISTNYKYESVEVSLDTSSGYRAIFTVNTLFDSFFATTPYFYVFSYIFA